MKKTKPIPPDEITTLLYKAEEHLEKSEYAQAEKLANDVLSLANGEGPLSHDDEAHALCILGECCWRTARYDDALTHCHNALTTAEASSILSLQSRALNGEANVHNYRGDFNKALHTAEHALTIAEKTEDKKQQSQFLNTIGIAHRSLGDFLRALEYYARALAIAEEIGNKESVVLKLGNIGTIYELLGDYPRSLDYTSRALAIAEEIGSKYAVAVCLVGIANVYWDIEDNVRALDYYVRALPIAEEIGDKESVATILGNIGRTYMNNGDYPRALEYLKYALDLSEQIGANSIVSFWMGGLAFVQRKLGNLDGAYHGFLSTLNQQRDMLKSNEAVVGTLLNLGGVLIEQGKNQEGLARLNEALTLAEELGQKKKISDTHKEISDAYSQMGDTASAFEHLKMHLAFDKEIFSEESKKKIEIFNMRVAIAEKEIQTEVQKLRADDLENQMKIQQLELEKNEQQLANSAIHLATQTEMLGNFRNEMRQIVREINEPISALKKIKEKLKELPCESVDWVKFEKEFIAVHPEFRAKLTEKYPELTKQEIKMCQLARLGLKTYEMSRLLCLSERTIDGHRNGLRKKMGVKPNENLKDFLQGIR